MPTIKIFQRPDAADLPLPAYVTPGAGAMDVFAATINDQTIILPPGGRITIPTGIYVEIPMGYVIDVRPRSGLAHKHGITIVNSPGTIDSDYRGEVGVILLNTSDKEFIINRGDRIAQILLIATPHIEWAPVNSLEDLSNTERGAGGYGSTGRTS